MNLSKTRLVTALAVTLGLVTATSMVQAGSIIDVPTNSEQRQVTNQPMLGTFTGGAIHSYSFTLPPGTNNLQPSLGLSYSSHGVNGFENSFGSGWNLNHSYIERDPNFSPANTNDDKFYLYLNGDRQELVFDSGLNFYKTKVDSFSRIQQLTGSSVNQQSTYWLVTQPNGTRLRFGFEASSEDVCGDRPYVRRWYLDQVTDTNNNSIFYTYQEISDYSYLDKIEYNNDKARLIDLVYTPVTEAKIGTLAGCRVQQSQRLDKVEIKVNNLLYKKYQLAYQTGDTSQNLLTLVTEFDGANNSLPASNFSYHSEQRQWSSTPSIWFNSNVNPDLSLDYRQTKLIDVDRDSLPDFVWSQMEGSSRRLKVYKNTGSAWSTTATTWYDSTTYPEVDLTRDDVRLTDVTADSLPDVVWSKVLSGNQRQWQVLVNTGSSWSTSAQTWLDSAVDGKLDLSRTDIQLQDVNGDSKADIVRSEEYQDNGTKYRFIVYLNTGNSWSTSAQTWLTTSLAVNLEHLPPQYIDTDGDLIPDRVEYFNSRTRLIDVTGDGLPDLVYTEPFNNDTQRRWQVFINTGDSWNASPQNWLEAGSEFDLGNKHFTMLDANGDGLEDIVKGQKYNGPWHRWEVWLNQGNNWKTTPVEFLNNNVDTNLGLDANNVATADINGDGLIDLVSTDKQGPGDYRIWKVTLNLGHAPNRLNLARSSLGGSTSLGYIPSTILDNTGTDNLSDLPFNLWIVSTSTTNNGMTGTHQVLATTNYQYLDGSYDFTKREFRGFAKLTAVDAMGKTIHKYLQDEARAGREFETLVTNLSDVNYLKTETTWTNTLTNNIYTVLPTAIVESRYDGQASPLTKQTTIGYDTFGNQTQITQGGDPGTTSDDRIQQSEFAPNTSSWLVAYPKKTWHRNAQNVKLAETFFYYDSATDINTPPTKGNLTKLETWHDRGQNPVTSYTYDSYGNQTSVTDPNNHTTTTFFGTSDPTFTFPDKVRNPLNQDTLFTYQLASGQILTQTDSNGNVTSFSYDGFGRPLTQVKPYDNATYPTTVYQYLLDGTAPELTVVTSRLTTGSSAVTTRVESIDGLNQVVQTKYSGESPSSYIVTDSFYDVRGNKVSQSNPYLVAVGNNYSTPDTTKPKTTTVFDVLNRPTLVTNPDTTTKAISYNRDLMVHTNERGITTDHTIDRFGQITKVVERNNSDTFTTKYEHNWQGKLIKITDDSNNVTLFSFDSLGRQFAITDPDLGTWLYYYDKNNNPSITIDNRGISVYTSYDALNRPIARDFPTDPDISFTYDLVTKGTLSQVQTSQYLQSYLYDQRLRPISETLVMDGFSWTTASGYNSADQVTAMTYPDAQQVTYTVNAQGLVDQIPGIINGIDYTPEGKIAQKTYANGLISAFTYHPQTTRLTRLQTGSMQDLTYVYDNVGNVTTWANAATSTTRTYTYDHLDRLKTATNPLGDSFTYDYDALGNMVTMKVNSNSYQFSYGGSGGPHALSAGNFTSPLGFILPAFTKPKTTHPAGYFFSFDSTTTVGGVALATADIGHYNSATNTWQMYFDGSDVGATALNSFELLPDGSILMSFKSAINLGWGSLPNQDIVRFIPTQLGNTTEGVFEQYFDGSMVELTSTDGSVDALASAGPLDMLISTSSSFSAGGILSSKVDMNRFIPTGLRHVTAGSYRQFFKPTSAQISSTGNLTAASFDAASNKFYFAKSGNNNIFTCIVERQGSNAACTQTATISTASWGITTTASGFHYNSGIPASTSPVEPDLISGIYLSHDNSYTTLGSLTVYPEDIAYLDMATKAWTMYIDGSDIGLDNLKSFEIMPNGHILMSFATSETFPFGTVQTNDIVKFIPTSTGDVTAGTFEMYFDGSDLGISDVADIGGIGLDPTGKLLIALDTRQDGTPVWGDVNATYVFNATSYGATTAGTLTRYFEGDDDNLTRGYTALSGTATSNLYLVPDGLVKRKHVKADGEHDILRCQPASLGAQTSCQLGLLFDADYSGYSARIDGLTLKVAGGSQ